MQEISKTGSVESKAAAFATSLEATIKSFRMYPPDHPACQNAIKKPHSILQELLTELDTVVLSVIDGGLAVNGTATGMSSQTSLIASAIQELALRSIVLTSKTDPEQLSGFLRYFTLKMSKKDKWSDLRAYLKDNAVTGVEVDTLRYELVGDDEQIVSKDAPFGVAGPVAGQAAKMTLEFANLAREHPEFLIGLLSDRGSGEKKLARQYEKAIDFEKLNSDIEAEMGEIAEDQLVRIVGHALKRKMESEEGIDEADLEHMLFGIRSMVEKVNNPNLVPKVKKLVEELNLIDENLVDLILSGKHSKKKLAFEELEKFSVSLESGLPSEPAVRQVPKRLEALEDRDYTGRLLSRIFDDLRNSARDPVAFAGYEDSLLTLVDSAIKEDTSHTIDELIQILLSELGDVSIEMPYFGALCEAARRIGDWLLDDVRLEDVHRLAAAVRKFSGGEVAYAEGVNDRADDFLIEFASGERIRKIITACAEEPSERLRVTEKLLDQFPTYDSALALIDFISHRDRGVRLMILRVLADYKEPTLRAFGTLLDDKKLIERQPGSTDLTLESYYKIRNIIFVSGNLGLADAVAVVEKFVAESDQRVVENVIEALEKLGCERSARLLAGYLHSPSDKIVRKAISAIGNIGGATVMPHLLDAYKSNPEMRSTLAPIIAKVGGEDAVEFLGSLLNRRESYIKEILSKSVEAEKIAVVSALARIKSTRSIAVLKEFRQSSSSGILGLFKSTALSQAVDRAIGQIERDLSTGQNS